MPERSLTGEPAKQWASVTESLSQGLQRPVIRDSWRRSEQFGVGRHTPPLFTRVSDGDLQDRIQRNAALMEAAKPLLAAASATLEGPEQIIYITDADGIVLHACGSEVWMAMQALMPGYDWSEQRMGTNGAGTALATRRPVAVIGPEHFVDQFSLAACFGAPVLVRGQLMGAVDLSVPVSAASPQMLQTSIDIALAIGKALEQEA